MGFTIENADVINNIEQANSETKVPNIGMADNLNVSPGAGEQDRVDTGQAGSASAHAERSDSEQDKIHISDEVLTQIVAIAAGKIPGITIASSGVGEGIAGLLGKKGPSRGIRIETDGNEAAVDISIAVEYGIKISDAAKNLQNEIRSDLAEMTGFEVINVNVHVTSVNMKDAASAR